MIVKTKQWIVMLLLVLWSSSSCSPIDSKDTLRKEAQAANSSNGAFYTFDGLIFIATTQPKATLWESAGWVVSEQSMNHDAQDLPINCTLYKHEKVVNQWFGRCAGTVIIPQMGAEHIVVVVTNPDGSQMLIQVAPPPN